MNLAIHFEITKITNIRKTISNGDALAGQKKLIISIYLMSNPVPVPRIKLIAFNDNFAPR